MIRTVPTLALTAACIADAATPEDCWTLRFSDRDGAESCFQELLWDDSPQVVAEAAWGLGDVRAANRAFHQAARQEPDNADIKVRWGELFLATYQVADAQALFGEALEIDPAHAGARLGLARVAFDRFEAEARRLVLEVLDAQPDHTGALLLLARLALEVGDHERARQALEGPVESANTAHRLEAMGLMAAMDHVADRVPSPWEHKALAIAPGYGAMFETIAHFYVIGHRYREAVAQLERALEVDPALWSAHAALGTNLLRINRFEDAKEVLARAHEGDPYNAQVVNTLRLLDSLDAWQVLREDDLILRAHPAEVDALKPYVRRLVGDAVRVVGERYGFVPDYPVVVEIYPRHQDFAVRTSGLPGIGALGVAFGDVVAMDSPSARSIDEGFDWASALWHEVAHVITLGATDNRVSRWFTEGISVLEEWTTGPSRFQGVNPAESRRAPTRMVVAAYRDDRLLPVATLDEGFIRPTYEQQVMVSYVQSGLLCEYIAETYGHEALQRILAAYRAGKATIQAVEESLEIPHDALDTAFTEYLDERFAGLDTDAFGKAMDEASSAAEQGDWATAAAAAARAVASFPTSDPPSPYPLLAEAQMRLGDPLEAAQTLLTYWRAGGRSTSVLARLIELLNESGRVDEALDVRRSLTLVAPLDPANRTRLGDALLARDEPRQALDEYLAALSLDPHDAADAHYRIARAYHRLNDTEKARRHVLLALEIAPRFSAALSLLLEINR